jgi:hypothetical protein
LRHVRQSLVVFRSDDGERELESALPRVLAERGGQRGRFGPHLKL